MIDYFEFLNPFHFIRPHWLYALIPAILLFVWLVFKKQKTANWSRICDKELLDYFLVENGKTTSHYPIILLLLSWVIGIFSLAGPSWEKIETPVYTNQNALVIILDLSGSMNASDLKPSRLERAKHKLTDILKQRQEGQTALIVYAGDAHIVSPLTPDNKTILSFIPVLDSSLMPVSGSNLNKALNEAEKLFKNSAMVQGRILLLSDGINEANRDQLSATITKLKQSGYTLSVIGVGTEDGAPIPNLVPNETTSQAANGFIKDQKGNIVLSKLNNEQLQQLALLGGGDYHRMTITDQDIKTTLGKTQDSFKKQMQENGKQQSTQEQWQDKGSLFVLLILPLALLLFRKGWLLTLLIIILPYPYQPAYSMQWNDLWQRADQQGKQSFSAGNHQQAAEKFNDPEWKASSFYKAAQYQQALEQFSKSNTLEAKYNMANSLAKLKRLDEALKAYNEVLEKNPKHQDSLKNKKIVEDLIKKQEQDNKDNKDNKGNKNPDQKKDNKDDSDKHPQKDNKDPQNKEQSQEDQNEQQKKQQEQKKQEQEALDKQKEKQHQEKNNQPNSDKKEAQDKKEAEDKENKPKPDDSLFDKLSDEEQQSMQHYLKQIQDDPAYLLRRKFYLNSIRSKQQNPNTNNNQDQQPW